MNRQKRLSVSFWGLQLLVLVTVALAAFGSEGLRGAVTSLRKAPALPVVAVPRETPLRVAPLYDRPEMVSDAELAAVLRQLRPKFPPQKIKPNYVEHALRIWGVDATFRDPAIMSGEKMKDFLLNHGQYLASWGPDMEPLLQESADGVSIRYGKLEGASVHHDHFLACLTEAGVSLNDRVFTPQQHIRTINDVLQRALRDLRVDEAETEWSTLAFALWITPTHEWKLVDGRTVTFDMLADRLLRGAKKYGVCSGTHRVYTLMALVRLDNDLHFLQPATREKIMVHLRNVRQLIIDSQFADGHWPSNWYDGAAAVKTPANDQLYQQVISTGHHLEWLAIAPEELHPPRAQIEKAARWVIRTTVEQKPAGILANYTFFSHVAGALSLWRHTRPADFWRKWEATHPEAGAPEPAESTVKSADAEPQRDADKSRTPKAGVRVPESHSPPK